MHQGNVTVEVRDRNLNRVGVIRPEDLDISVEDEHNNLGTWRLSLPVEHPLTAVLRTPGSGIIITGHDDIVLMSGPTITPQYYATKEDPGGMVVINGVTDSIVLADMLSFPDPSNVNPTTQTLSHDERSGTVESVMHAYVNANIGPGAPAPRRKAKLIMGTDRGRGPVIHKKARFPVLGVLLTELADIAGLGYRVIQRGDQLVFETYEVADRSDVVRLDIDNNTLASAHFQIMPPGVTQVIIAGQGDLVNRQFYAATTSQALEAETMWGRRIERFVDQRQTDNEDEHESKAAAILASEGFTAVAVNAVPADDTTMRFGHDFGMGDTIAAVVDNGEARAVVSGFVMKWDSSGYRLGIKLGKSQSWGRTSDARLSDVERRIAYLERSS